jgi:hypothetical protein
MVGLNAYDQDMWDETLKWMEQHYQLLKAKKTYSW